MCSASELHRRVFRHSVANLRALLEELGEGGRLPVGVAMTLLDEAEESVVGILEDMEGVGSA